MPIYEFASDEEIRPLKKTTFVDAGLQESDLRHLLRADVGVVAPDTLVIAEEFADWEGSRLRIDLLGIDKKANPVVIEIKRTGDGGHMDLQALRYAAMISTMTFEQAAVMLSSHLKKIHEADTGEKIREADTGAREKLLGFLGWKEIKEDEFARDVRIVLASPEFNPELTTSVLWLRERGIDIRCARLQPYENGKKKPLVDVQQIIPLPEAADYQVSVAAKSRKEREARARDWTRYDVTLGEHKLEGLLKRRAIHEVFRYLVTEKEVDPKEVAKHCGRSVILVLASVEGEVANEEDFSRRAREAREKEGYGFDPSRFFCGEGELLKFRGRTYAFSNQWGDPEWTRVMEKLCNTFSNKGIAFERSE